MAIASTKLQCSKCQKYQKQLQGGLCVGCYITNYWKNKLNGSELDLYLRNIQL